MSVAPPLPTAASSSSSDWKHDQLERRYRLLHRLILVVGLVVHWPALRARYCFDDYFHASMVHGTYPAPRGPFNLYDFIADEDRAIFWARGAPFPWWTDPHLKLRFLRPLSSALIWVERTVLGDQPGILHAISFCWWMAAVVGARSIFKRVLSPRAAVMATAIFAFAPCHSLPLAWLANREALVSLTFGLFALGASVRFLEAGRARDAIASFALFSLACLSGEYSFGLGGYVLVLAIASRQASIAKRLTSLALFAVPSLIYLIARSKLGYGSAGSGSYIDPLTKPVLFLTEAPSRLGPLLANGWFSLDGDTITPFSSRWWLAPFGIAALAICRALWRAFRALDSRSRAHGQWLLGGSLLAILPVLAVAPSPRLLGASMLGLAASVALVVDRSWFIETEEGRYDQLSGLVALGLAFLHFAHGPMTAWLIGRRLEATSATFESAARDFTARHPDLRDSEVIVVRGGGGSLMLPFGLDATFAPPKRFHMLAHAGHVLALRRGPNTLDLVAADTLFAVGPSDLFREEHTPIAKGDVFALGSMHATVLEMGEHGPRIVRFEMEKNLDSYVWLAEEMGGFRDVTPPNEGTGKPFDP